MNNKFIRLVFYIFFSLIIGVFVGVADFIFAKGLDLVTNIREVYNPYILIFLPIIGVVIVYFYNQYGKNSSKGMGLIFQAIHSKEDIIPKRLLPFVVVSTWLTHLFGGSAGREGVAVQIGATISNTISMFLEKKLNINFLEIRDIIISCGISAGFSGLFGTPIAATIFSMEVLKIGVLSYYSLLPSLIAAYTAFWISNLLGVRHFTFVVKNIPEINGENLSLIILCSLIFGFVGYLFSYLLKKMKSNNYLKNLNPIKKIFFGSIILATILFLFHKGRYSGLGTNLISSSFLQGDIYLYDWLLKMVLTVFTLGIGFQGGEVTPLFSIGASLGVVLGKFFNLPIQFISAIGYCTVFSSATNTFLTSVFIGLEIFGYNMMPYLFLACAISFLFSGDLGIYSEQKKEYNKF